MAATTPGVEAPVSFELIAAGGSNLTYRASDRAIERARSWLCGAPPEGRGLATAHDMGREWLILSRLHGHSDVPVPAPLAYCDDESVTGASFSVMEFVDGRILRAASDARTLSTDIARTATESMVATQVAMHTLGLGEVGLADLGRHDGYVARQLSRWRRPVGLRSP